MMLKVQSIDASAFSEGKLVLADPAETARRLTWPGGNTGSASERMLLEELCSPDARLRRVFWVFW